MMEMFVSGRVWTMTIRSSSQSGRRLTLWRWRSVTARLLEAFSERIRWGYSSSWLWIKHSSSLSPRMESWWRRAPTTRCRSTRFLTATQTASWPGSPPMLHMSSLTAADPELLLDRGKRERESRLTWELLDGFVICYREDFEVGGEFKVVKSTLC